MSVTENEFPVMFWGVAKKSVTFFRLAFINYLLLSILSYLPFLVIDLFSTSYAIDLIEFFHGNFLDIIIFLTLPTVYLQNRVYPVATLQLFFQRFFASAVVISFIQFGTLALFTLFFTQISISIILIGMIPYIYLLFAGFFLIMENSSKLISVKANLLNSINLVRSRFIMFFVHYLFITFITSLPFVLFFMWYMVEQPEFTAFQKVFQNQPNNTELITERLLALLESFNKPGFHWSRVTIHVLFRPIKSLFLAFLFLGVLFRINPNAVKSYLGFEKTDEVTESETAAISDDEDESSHEDR